VNEIWILGGPGRVGGVVAPQRQGTTIACSGGARWIRLRELAGAIGGIRAIAMVSSVDAVVTELSRSNPAVVINTIGPASQTALPVAQGCPPGTDCVDLANDLFAVTALLGLHDEAVRVDARPRVESEAGQIGSAFAATIIDFLATGGREYADNRLVRTGLGSHPERPTLRMAPPSNPAAVRAATWKSPAASVAHPW
jgi:hypothetical protein